MNYSIPKDRKKNKIALLGLAGLLVLAIVLFFSLRNTLLRRIINHKLLAVEQRYNLDINYTQARFIGLGTVSLMKLSVVPAERDTLTTVDSLLVSVRPLDVILNRLRFTNLIMAGTHINLKRTGNNSNYLFLLDSKKDTIKADTLKSERDYGSRVAVLMDALFNHIPATTRITGFSITADLDSNYFAFLMPDLHIRDRNFTTRIQVTDDTLKSEWLVNGHLDSREKDMNLSIQSVDKRKVRIPYIFKRWNTAFAFDSAGLEVSFSRGKDGISHLKGDAVLKGPMLNHPQISPEDVELKQSEIAFSVNIDKSSIEVDSTTFISFNETGFHPYFKYTLQPGKEVTIAINEPEFDAQTFFNSLPAGLFSNLTGIKVRGNLSFKLYFKMDFNQPDSLHFDAALRGKGFAVEQFGNTGFTFINEPFLYTAYENGQPVRVFMVGEENPNFRRLDQIPEHLKNAIMTSEDGQFYSHNGFIPDAIRSSIITNIKEKRFARGGSTISMQLVKNVFLNRNKNITRKVEEMLITWLIESRQMVTKDRMLEVYLNIIETGPLTYGVNEAAHFYFNKDVSKLTLAESIYIASIVPRPKLFKYSFDKEGNLREYLAGYYSLVSGKMLNKEWITQEEYDKLKPEITIKGPALKYIVTDTIPPREELNIVPGGFKSLLEIFKKKTENNRE